MSESARNRTAQVSLTEHTIAGLIARKVAPDETLDMVIQRLLEKSGEVRTDRTLQHGRRHVPTFVRATHQRYCLDVLGDHFELETLDDVLVAALNAVADSRPHALTRLLRHGGPIGRMEDTSGSACQDLRTLEFRPGWWVRSAESSEEAARTLKRLCAVSKLSFGRDVSLADRDATAPAAAVPEDSDIAPERRCGGEPAGAETASCV